MSSVQVNLVEERWTPTTIQATFVFQSSERKPGGISIDLPLGNLGWTFALSLEPPKPLKSSKKGKGMDPDSYRPASFSFRRVDSATPWGDTSIRAQLSLTAEPTAPRHTNVFGTPSTPSLFGTPSTPSVFGTPPICVGEGSTTPLGTINVALAGTLSKSAEVPLTTPCDLLISKPNKVCLTVTLSDCPLPDGLFQARSSQGTIQAQLVQKSRDLLSRSLGTGKPFDVKFLTSATRSTSRKTGDPLPTYASVSILEEHVDLSSSVLRESWTNALLPLSTKCHREISCSDEYNHELDSDFEDEDEAPLCSSSTSGDPADRADQGSDGDIELSSTGPFSSLDLEKAGDLSSVDHLLEEVINVKCPKEPSSDANCERTIEIKFAAHRTWHAFLWYCYTGHLEFRKLRSQVRPGGRHPQVTSQGGPPACSPKSMYRLADLVGNNDLKAKALAAIGERMTEENVLDEAFSIFTSKYPEVREVQLGVLDEHRRSPMVKQAFLGAMEKYGSMPHAKPVLSAFYDNMMG